MQNLRLADCLSDEVYDFLLAVETTFDFRFEHKELEAVSTFGELFDHIKKKLQHTVTPDCTTQQAFYKLREGISAVTPKDSKTINPDTSLALLFPKKYRKANLQKLEKQLGFKMHILTPNQNVLFGLFFLLLASVVFYFFNTFIGSAGLVVSVVGFWFALITATDLQVRTVMELATKITTENYAKARRNRRNPATYNAREVEKVLLDLFKTHIEYIPKSIAHQV